MPRYHETHGFLAPRHRRPRHRRRDETHRRRPRLLDMPTCPAISWPSVFPTSTGVCLELGIDMTRSRFPVVPAAHYSCGWGDCRLRTGAPASAPLRHRRGVDDRAPRGLPAGSTRCSRRWSTPPAPTTGVRGIKADYPPYVAPGTPGRRVARRGGHRQPHRDEIRAADVELRRHRRSDARSRGPSGASA